VFGRTNEEIAAARAAGIPCTIIPGITASLAAAASLGLSLSERDRARRIQFITAHAADGSLPRRLDWAALVDPEATTAVYMGVKTLPALTRRLLEEGLDPMTPAVMIENASLPEERRFVAALADMPALIAAQAIQGPCMLLYGRTLDRATPNQGSAGP
jgi:uroporphyrin-III C-methyltransferase/precorrin-2 dehydrogenase/sirohydrochlorin ferrochelatase